MFGPIYIHSSNDEYVKSIYGDTIEEITDLSLKNYFEQNNCKIVDEEMNEINKIKSEDPFYIKIEGPRNYFVQATISTNLKKLYTKLYTSDNSKKQYIILDSRDLVVKSIKSIIGIDVEYSDVYINFLNADNEEIKNISYYIYDENGEIVQNIDGFSKNGSSISLPAGKYYVQQYDAPSGYIINQTKYELNITGEEEKIELNITNDSIYSLTKNY